MIDNPRPDLPTMVNMVEKAFELSEVSNTPVMVEVRIRGCHVHGRFKTKDNKTLRGKVVGHSLGCLVALGAHLLREGDLVRLADMAAAAAVTEGARP